MQNSDIKPWYQQKWPWLIISLPLLTVIAGIITYQIAANKPHSMVKDDYFKEGLAINQSITKLENARAIDLKATINIDKDAELMFIKLSTNNSVPVKATSIKVFFSHPTQAKLDQTILFEKLSSDEFVAAPPQLPQAYWHIRIMDEQENWLLKKRWHYPENNHLEIHANH
ncbi:FixH family protein [Aliikangiella sp. IMCC44359]|uniref:FixH family protein n=1 Tax=Aliikangiella sp. IMCC44359 TaxID=3459125 RepID=UPI00403B02C4